jgi:hypothetical protein
MDFGADGKALAGQDPLGAEIDAAQAARATQAAAPK